MQGSDGKAFERLAVYRRAYDLALNVHRGTLEFPRIEQFGLADQMRRASKSICANIAEGSSRQWDGVKDWHRYLTIATGSADEMQVWCGFARDLGCLDGETCEAWRRSYEEIARMLNGLKRSKR